ncbi:MAG: DUF6503 family protein [Owenweeksia sp.]
MRTKFLSLLFSIAFLAGCQENQSGLSFAKTLEEAHQKEEFLKKEAIQFDLVLNFGGNERLNGTLTLLTNSSKGRIDYKDGSIIIYDEDKLYFSPEIDAERVSFTAYTWSYFFLMPYKLTDPGTRWKDFGDKELKGKMYDVQKLTFDPGTGASPDDWYIVYRDPNTKLLHSAAYIVTAGKSREEAEKDPHAIEYLNYEEIEGIPIATAWNFWAWRSGQGFTKKLGNAQLSRVRFTQLNQDFFEHLPGMQEADQ